MDFITGGSVIVDYGLVFWPEVKVLKRLNDGFVSYKHTAFHFIRR